MIRAVFFDIDGTLVSFRTHAVSEETFSTLDQLRKHGIRVFIATGRAKDGLAVLKKYPFDGYITLNGQYDYITEEQPLYENTIDREDLKVLLAYEAEHHFPCGFVLPDKKIFNFRDHRVDEVHAITNNDAHPAGDVTDIMHEKVYQVMTFINAEEEKELMRYLPHCTSSRWYPTFCDISPLGGTKTLGMDLMLDYYDIPLSETMAFGDGGNDMTMLEHAGIGIAMGNAAEELKKAADDVTDDVDHEGIAKACRKYGLI